MLYGMKGALTGQLDEMMEHAIDQYRKKKRDKYKMKRMALDKKSGDPFYTLLQESFADEKGVEALLAKIPMAELERYMSNLTDD